MRLTRENVASFLSPCLFLENGMTFVREKDVERVIRKYSEQSKSAYGRVVADRKTGVRSLELGSVGKNRSKSILSVVIYESRLRL